MRWATTTSSSAKNQTDRTYTDDDALSFIINTWLPVGILIVIGLLFARRAGWLREAVPVILIFLGGSLLIGIGEELYFRGIFRVAIRGHHGELAALLITSIAFGLGHVVGYLFNGVPLPATALAVAFLAMDGALFYGALRATGTLWVPILLHGLGDFARFMQSGSDAHSDAPVLGGDAVVATVEYVLIALSIALVISVARSDHRARKSGRETRIA